MAAVAKVAANRCDTVSVNSGVSFSVSSENLTVAAVWLTVTHLQPRFVRYILCPVKSVTACDHNFFHPLYNTAVVVASQLLPEDRIQSKIQIFLFFLVFLDRLFFVVAQNSVEGS